MDNRSILLAVFVVFEVYIHLCQGCTGDFYSSGTYTTPGYQEDGSGLYQNSLICRFTFHPAAGYAISLKITSVSLEMCFDIYNVYKGIDNTGTHVGTHCDNLDRRFSSDQDGGLHLLFTTDGSGVRNGFKFEWTYYTGCIDSNYYYVSTWTTTPGFMEDGSGQYTNNLDCDYIINPVENKAILLKISSVTLEPNTIGCYDSYVISRHIDNSGSPTGPNCDPINREFSSRVGGALIIKFTTDGSGVRNGFKMEWNYYTVSCDGSSTSSPVPSYITSPGFWYSSYPVNLDCSYYISPPSGKLVKMFFVTFETEADNDFVYFYTNGLQYYYSGYQTTSNIKVAGQIDEQIQIRMTSNNFISGKGYKLGWIYEPAFSDTIRVIPKTTFTC